MFQSSIKQRVVQITPLSFISKKGSKVFVEPMRKVSFLDCFHFFCVKSLELTPPLLFRSRNNFWSFTSSTFPQVCFCFLIPFGIFMIDYGGMQYNAPLTFVVDVVVVVDVVIWRWGNTRFWRLLPRFTFVARSPLSPVFKILTFT